MSSPSKIKVVFSGLSMSGVSSITSLFVTGCYRGSDLWYRPNERWTRIQRRVRNLNLTLFDLSGETSFLDKVTTNLSPIIFKDTGILVYVIDLYDIKELPQAKHYLEKEVECLIAQNPDLSLYVFLNKIDQIPKKLQDEVVNSFKDHLNENPLIKEKAHYYITSLYTGSIFLAFDDLFWDILYSSSLNILLNEFKREFWSLDTSEIEDYMKKIMCIESTSIIPIFPIGNEIINFQDDIKDLIEANEPIFLEYGEGAFVNKASINQIKYSLYQSQSFQRIFAFLLLFEMNEQAWNVIPIFDMLLENLIQKRFQGEEISVKRDFVNPLLPFLIQPSKFKIAPEQDEEVEKFSKFLNSHIANDFSKVTLKELLVRFAQNYIEDRSRQEDMVSLASQDISEDKLPQRPSSPLETLVPTPTSSEPPKEIIMEDVKRPQRSVPQKKIKVPPPPQYYETPSQEEEEEVDLLSLPLRDVLKLLRDKE